SRPARSSRRRRRPRPRLPPRRRASQDLPRRGAGRAARPLISRPEDKVRPVGLAEDFDRVVAELPPDWTALELDLRLADEDRYIDAATLLTVINAMPYSKHDWHFRLRVAHEFGHAAAVPTVHGALTLLDGQGIEGELVPREVRVGRVEVTQMWGRPESVRQEFRRRRAQ